MKTQFLLTCFVATFTMLSANVHNILSHYAIAFALWGLSALRAYYRNKRREGYRRRAYLREKCMHHYLQSNRVRY